MNKNWITQQSYDHGRDKITYPMIKEDPEKYGYTKESVKVKTVPGQSISVKELLERYEKGRPIPQE